MQTEIVEDKREPGTWRAESVGTDGECYVTLFMGPNAEARAREWSAAPELLAALRAMLEVFGGHEEGDVPAEDQACAAIAKAEGK